MPELPEVETVVRGLRKTITGLTISRAEVLHPKPLGGKSPRQFSNFIRNRIVTGINRFGKYIQISLSDDRQLICHLRMTGKFIFQPGPVKEPDLLKHVRYILHFTDHSCLLFRDTRIFGTVSRGKEGFIDITTADTSQVIIKIRECPLHFSHPGMCLAHTAMEKTVVEELNPGLTYRIGKSIPAWEPFCEHIIELKSS